MIRFCNVQLSGNLDTFNSVNKLITVFLALIKFRDILKNDDRQWRDRSGEKKGSSGPDTNLKLGGYIFS